MSVVTIKLTVLEARDLPPRSAGAPSPLSPYCIIEAGSTRSKSKVKSKTQTPVWNETFLLNQFTQRNTVITVYDDACQNKTDYVGKHFVDLSTIKVATDSWFRLQPKTEGTNVGEIHLRFDISVKDAKIPQAVLNEMKERLAKCQASGSKQLDLSSCYLPMLPKLLSQSFSFLVKLDLSFNSLSTVPDFSAFTALQELELRGNQLRELNDTIGTCPSLRILSASGNGMEIVNGAIGKLVNLEKLELANNQIIALPPEIGRLRLLTELLLTGNPLVVVPPSIGGLANLEVIDLSCCNLERLPEEFTLMSKLLDCNLGANKLHQLPAGMGRLTHLAKLNLMDNQLTDLPLSIGYCKGLGEIGSGIQVARNPLQDPVMVERAIIGADHLLEYLERKLAMANYPSLDPLPLNVDFGEGPPVSTASSVATPTTTTTTTTPTAQSPAPQSTAAVTASPYADIVVDTQLIQKVNALKKWAVQISSNDLIRRLAVLRNETRAASDLSELVPIGNRIKYLNKELAKIKQSVPFVDVKPPMLFYNEENLVENLRILTMEALNQIDNALRAITASVPDFQPPQDVQKLFGIVQILNDLKKVLM
ncbi:leucine rich repeat protein [Pelomyxa schiedti]|nr:leucine rich repeat protein [Pelomyxa schiedti]